MNSVIKRKIVLGVACVTPIGAAALAVAHHSTAMYDYKQTKMLSGTVKEFQWTNPHMFIKVLAPDATGKQVKWNIECGTPNINARHGWKKSDLKVGDKVSMEINPMRDGTAAGTLKWVKLSDGRQLWGPASDIVALPAAGAGP